MTSLWEPLTEEQREQLVEEIMIYKFSRNDLIYKEGDEPFYLMYLLEGMVTISNIIKGKQHIVRMVEPGCMFGYLSSFNNTLLKQKAITGDNTVIAFIPMTLIYRLMRENSAFTFVFIKDLTELLDLSLHYTINLTRKHINGRMAQCLLRMKEKYGVGNDGQSLPIYLSRENLAGMSNMTTSNAIRTLSAFADMDCIALEGRIIKILDEERLRYIAQTE